MHRLDVVGSVSDPITDWLTRQGVDVLSAVEALAAVMLVALAVELVRWFFAWLFPPNG